MASINEQMHSLTAALFVADERLRSELRQNLAEQGIAIVQQTQGAFSWANVLQNADFSGAQAVIAELPTAGDFLHAVEQLTSRVNEGTFVVLLGRDSSVTFYHQLKRAGASEYFPLSSSAEEIAGCIRESLVPREPAPVKGRVLAVVGAGTGVGMGMVASVLACGLSRSAPVVVVDGGLAMPTVGSYFGVDVPGSLPVMLRSQERLDAVLVEQALTQPRPQIKLLDGFEPVSTQSTVGRCARLIHELGRHYDWQVWRVPLSAAYVRSLLGAADLIVPVVNGVLPSIRLAQAMAQEITQAKTRAPIAWVFNHRNATDTVGTAETARHLGVTFAGEIAFQKRLGAELAQPMRWLESSNPVEKALRGVLNRALSLQAGEDCAQPAHTSLWSKLWK